MNISGRRPSRGGVPPSSSEGTGNPAPPGESWRSGRREASGVFRSFSTGTCCFRASHTRSRYGQCDPLDQYRRFCKH
eukprot:628842-Prorocentrum_minimum.AAC.1